MHGKLAKRLRKMAKGDRRYYQDLKKLHKRGELNEPTKPTKIPKN